jgi:ribosomal-protein-alanine N-acetyltransferase
MNGHEPITVEPMQVDDIPRVFEIDQLSFPLPWSQSSYRYELTQNPNSHFYVALAGSRGRGHGAAGETKPAPVLARLNPSNWFRPTVPVAGRRVIGYGGFWFILDEAHVSTIAVHPDWRGQGIGERLLATMLEQALDLGAVTATLEVRVSNARAQGLYRKYDFEVVGRRKHYYRDNSEDALLMTAQMGPGYRESMRRRSSQKRKGAGQSR